MNKIFSIISYFIVFNFIISCGTTKTVENPDSTPAISTINISNITSNSAQSGGFNLSDGGASVLSKGVCWGISSSSNLK